MTTSLLENKDISEMRRHIAAASRCIDALEEGYRSPEKVSTLLDALMQQVEISCIELRRISERSRPRLPTIQLNTANYYTKTIYGEVTLMVAGWLHIRLNTLLPHYRVLGGTQYLTDCITRLLDQFQRNGGNIPLFDKAFLAIVEHCTMSSCKAYDQDNKGFHAVTNAMKGRLYPDDDQFELSLGLFTSMDDQTSCHIYVLPDEEAGDFLYYRQAEGL